MADEVEPLQYLASTRPDDPELEVLGAIMDLLTTHPVADRLDNNAKARIVRYLHERFGTFVEARS